MKYIGQCYIGKSVKGKLVPVSLSREEYWLIGTYLVNAYQEKYADTGEFKNGIKIIIKKD